jgi:hypothetical protein
MDSSVIKISGGEIFRKHGDWRWEPSSHLKVYNGYQASSSAIKWKKRGVEHAPLSSAFMA